MSLSNRCPTWEISIHALREEGDTRCYRGVCWLVDFYPRPPRGGRRIVDGIPRIVSDISIHALREEGDTSPRMPTSCSPYFYPRPPRGGRPKGTVEFRLFNDFYPRPPRGGRQGGWTKGWQTEEFLSTPSARRATRGKHRSGGQLQDFYPRPPRGGRLQKQRQNLYFQINYTTFCTNLEEL